MSDALAVADAFRRLHNGIVVPDYEKLLVQTYKSFLRSGDVVIDVGAHAGRHTAIFAQTVGPEGRVYAYEPIPHLARQLTAGSAGTHWISVRNKALSHTVGSADFQLVPDMLEQSGLQQRQFDRAVTVQRITVAVGTLDDEFSALERLDYVKIDVEGAEIDCLTGGLQLFRRTQPIISVEYGSPSYSAYGHTAATLFDLAAANGMALSDFFGNVIEDRDEWIAVCDRSYWDFFLVPRPRVEWWRTVFAVPPNVA